MLALMGKICLPSNPKLFSSQLTFDSQADLDYAFHNHYQIPTHYNNIDVLDIQWSEGP